MPPRFILRDSLDRDRLEKLYLRDGLSMVQIGRRFFILRDSLDRDRLEKLYLRDGLSMVQIGRRFGVSATAVCRLLDEYDIPRRGTISLSIRHES
jgi:hypothetical protein